MSWPKLRRPTLCSGVIAEQRLRQRADSSALCESLSRLRGLGVGVSLVEHKGDLRLDPERRRDAVARDGLDLLEPHRAEVWDRARGAPHSLPGGIVIAVGRLR